MYSHVPPHFLRLSDPQSVSHYLCHSYSHLADVSGLLKLPGIFQSLPYVPSDCMGSLPSPFLMPLRSFYDTAQP